MIQLHRRAVLHAGIAAALSMFSRYAMSQAESSHADGLDLERKKEFVRQANAQWQAEFTKARAEALAAERRGEFSSVAPPKELKPFKDWDYYYLSGSTMSWSPNEGQPYEAVTVPIGFVTDLASVPQWLWSSGYRPEGDYAYSGIVHDFLYWTQTRPREEADNIFLMAMEDSKVAEGDRKKIFKAVRKFGGSSWKNNAKLKTKGERRVLKTFPDDFTITWKEWKKKPDVFAD